MKLIKIITSVIAVLIVVAIAAYAININIRMYDWKEKTTPLPQGTVEALCINFDLRNDDLLCDKTKDVYGPDFYETIRDTFRPYEEYGIDKSESATYEDVEKKIGMFKYECEPVVYQADGFSYFNCLYDLRSDREFIIGIMYTYPDNVVFRINTPMGFDGE